MSILRLGGAARFGGAILGIVWASVSLAGQPAPVPRQIPAAKNVFISNAGVDPILLQILRQVGEASDPLNRFYAAMKRWNRFDLVGGPSEADLVFEVRFVTELANCKQASDIRFWPKPLPDLEAQLEVTILDAKTHFILWTVDEPLAFPRPKANWSKSLEQGVGLLVEGVKGLAGETSK